MPSAALNHWKNDRVPRLKLMDAHCALLMLPPGPLLEESLQAYVMLLSGHFQGYCRDLYSECAQCCAAVVSSTLRATIQVQFSAALALNSGNPTVENIRRDFERFGFSLQLGVPPLTPQAITDLGHMNHWRNASAHQKISTSPSGIPPALMLVDIRKWQTSCDGLAMTLDDTMRIELQRILGAAPW